MKRRTKIGVTSTVVWIIIVVIVLYFHRFELDKTNLEGWGNFLAGFISPVAIFWLILGYLQQQEELKINTNALKLQQEELRKQVEETQTLVKLTEAQSKATIDLALAEKQRLREEYLKRQPLFKYTDGQVNARSFIMNFRNIGGLARQLIIETIENVQTKIQPFDSIPPNATGMIQIVWFKEMPSLLSIKYVDETGASGLIQVDINKNGSFVQRPPVA